MKLTAPENLTINFDQEEFIPEIDELIEEEPDIIVENDNDSILTWWD